MTQWVMAISSWATMKRPSRYRRRGSTKILSAFGTLVTLACAYAQQGRDKEAKHYVEELLRQIPRYSLRALRKNPMFVDPKLVEKLIECMRLAGLPE